MPTERGFACYPLAILFTGKAIFFNGCFWSITYNLDKIYNNKYKLLYNRWINIENLRMNMNPSDKSALLSKDIH